MSAGITPATSERAELVESGGRRGRRRWVVVALVLVLIAAGAVVVVRGVFDGDGGNSGSSDSRSATSLATVTRRSLSEHTQVNGTLGYAGSYTVLGRARGTVTWLPAAGAVIGDGQVLYRVDGAPVVLLYGATPAYRALAEGATAADVTGADVAQLNHDLAALGYVDSADVDSAWDEFNWATKAGVEKLQEHLGVDQIGKLSLGDVVFLPTAARVTTLQASLGAPATGPMLQASSTARTVSVALDADLQSEVKAGDRVTITLPDGTTTPGTVTSVGKVATIPSNNPGGGPGGSTPTVPVHIRPTHPAATGSLDQAPVQVTITQHTVHNVLAVPVTALLARAGGGYAVEVVAGDGTHHLVQVTPQLFDDVAGMVQVSGSGLAAGQHVVVPGNE
ncbi:MAG TPA: peptidoglycan-binding protein [Actinomycetes bacterium]|nr:peptidoglycan-binding protein [Actinomycetes bacterium]